MATRRRVDIRGILANPNLRRELMVPTLQATQAREDIQTSRDQAERAYYVVTEVERAAFFDLARFRGGKRSEVERRHEMFVRALAEGAERVRFDVARRDFMTIKGAPLSFRSLGLVAHVFREFPALEPSMGYVRQGGATANDNRYVRYWWEPVEQDKNTSKWKWEPFAKGGGFSRFYSDIYLKVHWDHERQTFVGYYGRKGRSSEHPSCYEHYFQAGLTWPLAGSAFNVRWMPGGCVFAHKGPAICPNRSQDTNYLAGILNTHLVEYLLLGLTSRQEMGGRWEVGIVKRVPIPSPSVASRHHIGDKAKTIHDAKASWDEGNEISTRFRAPWLIRDDLTSPKDPLPRRFECLARKEAGEESHIKRLYREINDETYRIYGIPDRTRSIIEKTLGERPSEVIWSQLEGKSPEQKRMEHVFRLLSYAVKRVVESDEDGIVPFQPAAGEPSLVDRVRRELRGLLPNLDVGQLEVDIVNELKRKVKGYRRTDSLAEWLESAFFEFHCSLYKNRPIIWHIASAQGTGPFSFGALVHYHKFDRNRMAMLRAQYLRDVVEDFRREAALAGREERTDDRVDWQSKLEEAQELDRRIQRIEEGHHEGEEGGERDYRILTQWKSAEQRPNGWDPDIDDGVKVNIEPLQKAGVLRMAKVV